MQACFWGEFTTEDAQAEGMIALITENTLKVTAGVRAREMIRSTIPVKGLRP